MSSSILQLPTPRKFVPLLGPERYKGAHGGRGSGKSHFFAEMMVETALCTPGFRGVCIREVQKTLAQSAKLLLEDKIYKLGLGHKFDVQDKLIRTPKNGLILFQGMQNHTADSIKSLEGFDVAWVEEAQNLSAHSLKLLRPTIRKPGSQLWFSWNPESPEAPVDKLLRQGTLLDRFGKPMSTVIEANWRDNPWFPEELQDERLSDMTNNPDEYDHIWEGAYLTRSEAIIFRNRVTVEPFEAPLGTRFHFGNDHGFANDPATLIRFYIEDDCLFIDHEAFGYHVEIDELAAMFDTVPGSREWPIRSDCSRPETISYLSRQGFSITAAEKWPGSVEDGIAHMKAFKKIVIHPRCENIAKEFRLYSYKVDRVTGDVLPIIVDKWNHGIDAVRYGLDGYIQRRGVASVWERLAGN